MVKRIGTIVSAVALVLVAAPGQAQRFLPDDPIWVDDDRLPIEEPGEIELSNVYDLLENTFNLGTPPQETDSTGGERQHTR